jgi:hypothetical protein
MLLSNSSSRVVDDVSLQSRTLLHRSNIPFLTCGNKSIRQYIYLSTIRPDIFLIYISISTKFNVSSWKRSYNSVIYIYPCNQRHAHAEVYSIRFYVIRFVSDLRQIGGFLQIPDIFLIYMFKYNVLWLVLLICNSTINTISVYRGDELFFFMATGVSGENHRSDASHWQTLSHKIVSSTPFLLFFNGIIRINAHTKPEVKEAGAP